MMLGTMAFSAVRHNLAQLRRVCGATFGSSAGWRGWAALLLLGAVQLAACERTGPGLEPPLAAAPSDSRPTAGANAGGSGAKGPVVNANAGRQATPDGQPPVVPGQEGSQPQGNADAGCDSAAIDAGGTPVAPADGGVADDCDQDAGS